jgi:hypothetical protein
MTLWKIQRTLFAHRSNSISALFYPPLPLSKQGKVSVSACKSHSIQKWRVSFWEFGNKKRKFFDTKGEADAAAAKIRGDDLTASKEILLLPKDTQQNLLFIYREAQKMEIDLARVVGMLHGQMISRREAPAIKSVLAELLLTLRSQC